MKYTILPLVLFTQCIYANDTQPLCRIEVENNIIIGFADITTYAYKPIYSYQEYVNREWFVSHSGVIVAIFYEDNQIDINRVVVQLIDDSRVELYVPSLSTISERCSNNIDDSIHPQIARWMHNKQIINFISKIEGSGGFKTIISARQQ